jgi:chromosome segregation ATPase
VVQGSAYLVARARPIARALLRALRGRTIPIVLIETESGRGETEFLDALEPLLAGAVFRVPSSAAVSDIVAVLAHARAFVGTSVAASLAAAGFGVPALRLEAGSPRVKDAVQGAAGGAVTVLASGTDLTAPVRRLLASSRTESLPSEIEARLESHFDRIAEIADSAGRRRSQQATRGRSRSPERLFAALRDAEERIETLRAAHEARGEQMLQQRFRLAEALERREAELKEEAARAAEEIARTRVALESIEGEKTRLEEALSISSGAFALARAEFEASHFRELEAASAGRAQVEQTLATEVAGRERLLAELSALQRDSDRLARDLAGTVEERDALSAELAALRNTTELLGEQLRSAREGIRSSEEIRTQAEAELARANAATEVLAGELTRLRSSLRHASEQESNLVISRAQALAELKASRGELEAMFRELEAVRVDREAEVARLRADLQNLQSQLHEVTSLKVFRYSAPFRAVYRRLLRLVRGRDRTA